MIRLKLARIHLESRFIPYFYFACCYLYILLRIQPALFYQCQIPVFIFDRHFFTKFLTFPGGPAEYFSLFLSQFYFFPVPGSLVITILLVLTYNISSHIIKRFDSRQYFQILAYVPSLLTLVLFSQYQHRMSYTLGFLLCMAFFLLYLASESQKIAIRFSAFTFLFVFLYYTGAGCAILFALLCFLQEILFKRGAVLGILFLIMAAAVPYIALSKIFILRTDAAYVMLLRPDSNYRPAIAPYLLLLFFPSILLLARTGTLHKIHDWVNEGKKSRLALLVLFILSICASLYAFDAKSFITLKVDYFARNKAWKKLLEFVRDHPSEDPLVAFQTNRALYHTNRLTRDMFAFNQEWGEDGLYLNPQLRKSFSIQVSDFYWDLSFLNESMHWAQEEQANYGNSPWNLQRIAQINIIQGRREIVAMCLDALNKTVLYRSWARRHQIFLQDEQAVYKNPEFQNLVRQMPAKDFIVNSQIPSYDVENILAQSPHNRMAFEYQMASDLLTFRLGHFVKRLSELKEFNYSEIPRLYQEALIIYLQNTGQQNYKVDGKRIQYSTIAEFNNFIQILNRHDGDAVDARDDLKKFADTYWYFNLYHKPTIK
jgi:hypothetical protein